MDIQVNSTGYDFLSYVDKKRWVAYYSQLVETLHFRPKRVLVVGVGDKLVVDCLKKQAIEVVSMDFDANLNPDWVGDIRNVDQFPGSFDVIVCCQILEHIPFAYFQETLDKIMSKTNHLVLSLPIQHYSLLTLFKLQRLFGDRIKYTVSKFYKTHIFDGQHYWEMGTKGYSKNRITKLLGEKYIIEREFVELDNKYHQFYILTNKPKVN